MESGKKKNRNAKINKAENKPVDDLLQICKPLSVNMTRLPTLVLNKYAGTSRAEVKNKNPIRKMRNLWKHGNEIKRRKRRDPAHQTPLLQTGEISEVKKKNVKEDKATEIKQISDGVKTNSNEHDEGSPEKIKAAIESDELNIDRTESEVEASELTPSRHETTSVTELHNALSVAAVGAGEESTNKVVAVEKPADNTPDPSSEQIDNSLSRKQSLRHAITRKNDKNRTIVRNMGKRKRSSQSNDAEAQDTHRLLQDTKRYKSMDGVAMCDEKTLPEGRNIEKSPNDIVSDTKQIKSAKSKRHNPKSVRRRGDFVKEARVMLTKLEYLLDPLVLRWTEKTGLELSKDAEATTRVTSPIDKRIEEKSQSIAIEESPKQASPVKESHGVPTIHNTELEVGINVNEAPATIVCAAPDTNNFTPLDEEIRSSGALAELQERSTLENEENDEEIMEFLRSPRKSRRSIDSSSTESMSNYQEAAKTPMLRRSARIHTVISSIIDSPSDSEEVLTARVLRSRAKTPSVVPERTRPDTRMSRMLRRANTPATDTLHSQSAVHQNEIPKTPPLRDTAIRTSIDSSTTKIEVEPSYEMRTKSRRLVIDDTSSESTYNPGEALTDMFDDVTPTPMLINNHNSGEKTINTHGRETEPRAVNIPTEKTVNNENSEYTNDGVSQVEAITEVQCDSLVSDDLSNSTDPASANRNDALIARKKLTALNAMVVLTRLENFDDISVDGMECKNVEDSSWLTNFSPVTTDDNRMSVVTRVNSNSNADQIPPDPLEIHEDHGSLSGEINEPIVGLSPRRIGNLSNVDAGKSSSRKSSRILQILTDDTDTRSSQDTAESDVELSLVLEDGDRSPDDFNDQSQTSGVGESVNSGCTPTEAILTDANGKSSHGEERQRDKQRTTTQNITATHKCVGCNGLFDDAELLKQHRASSAGCNVDLRCAICQATYKTASGLARHRAICAAKSSEKRKSVDESTINEADIDSHTDHDNTMETLTSKTKQKKSQTQKKLPKKGRPKTRVQSEEAICNVCSINFVTTQALSEHIYTHSQEENQEAYRKIKEAMMLAESQAARSISEKAKETIAESEEAGSSTIANVGEGTGLLNKSNESTTRAIRSNNRADVNVATESVTISGTCPCHRDDEESADKNDLQIEMVLVCQKCQVLFRRRECFEVHYRTSPRCANDRSRGRLPRLYCANCQSTLESWKNMRHHLEVHASENPEGTVRFVCNICRVVFVGFGALFYNHWFSHLKDTMFVASRYTFPKNSVQPKDGLAKLPIGASADETYIWVAEHVCAKCKKPFSTRPDLGLHQEIDPCCNNTASGNASKEPVNNVAQWYCDVCDLVFDDRDKLNEHGVVRHSRHYTCVSTSPRQKTFMCTKCCAMRKRIKDIEEHWKTDPKHNSCRFDMEINTETMEIDNSEPAIITPVGNKNRIVEKSTAPNDERVVSNSTIPSRDAVEKDKSRRSDTSVTKRIEKDNVRHENDNVFQPSVVNSQSENISYTDNQESSLSSPRVNEIAKTTASEVLDNLTNGDAATALNETSSVSKSLEKQKMRSRSRALEDPSVNVVLSDSSSTKLSASLVIDESRDRISDDTGDDSVTESYRILMMDNNPKSTSGPIKMVFTRKSSCNATENLRNSRTGESLDKSNGETVAEKCTPSKSTSGGANDGKSLPKKSLEKAVATDTAGAEAEKTTGKKNNDSSNIPKSNEMDLSLPALLKNKSGVPEIIEIIEEIELANETSQVPDNAYSSSSTNVSTAKSINKGKTNVRSKKSSVRSDKSKNLSATKKKMSQGNSSGSEINSTTMNDSGKSDNSDANSQFRRGSTLSFEEARYAAQVSKKQGFLRVKNLSELQEVKKYACQICAASFETLALLDEHSRHHLQISFGKFQKNRRGMAAALLLPEPSECPPKTLGRTDPKNVMQSSATLPTQSFIPQRIYNTAGNNSGAGNSWIRIENRNTTVTNSQSNAPNVNADAAKSVITSTASLAQSQQNFSNQSQTLNTPVGYIAVPDIHRQLSEVRTSGQIGYHILPAMVLPSSQSTKQPIAVASQQNTSSINLPTSGLTTVSSLNQQQISISKLVCTICTTFRCDTMDAFNEHITKHLVGFNNANTAQNAPQSALSTVTVPQGSSVRTANETAPDSIAESKSNNDRLVVNNWILQSPPISWPNSTFSQQTASSVLPMTTQPLLTTTVQNSNGNGTNTAKSAPIWMPPNSNNNGTNALKQSAGWVSSAFNTGEIIGGQIVYQCKICKTAMYSDYEHLRRHVLVVHGVDNFLKSRIENIVQKYYYCTRCPNGVELFDSVAKLTTHQNTGHANICPTCNRTFHNYIHLTDHIAHCRTSNSHGNFDGSC